MSMISLPSWDYPEEVLRILRCRSAQSLEFEDILAESEDEDLKEALRILETARNVKTRAMKIRSELRRRTLGSSKDSSEAWKKRFSEEWEKMRMAAGKA